MFVLSEELLTISEDDCIQVGDKAEDEDADTSFSESDTSTSTEDFDEFVCLFYPSSPILKLANYFYHILEIKISSIPIHTSSTLLLHLINVSFLMSFETATAGYGCITFNFSYATVMEIFSIRWGSL